MKVALDVTAATSGMTGVARYTHQLHRALLDLGDGPEVVPYAFGRGPHPSPVGTRRLPVPLRVMQSLWQATDLPRLEWFLRGIDLVHCLDLLPTPTRLPTVMTAHDLVAVEHPELHAPVQAELQRRQLAAFQRADRVVAVSQATAGVLVTQGVPADRISVTPLGFTELPPAGARAVASPYLLHVGELTPRKNLAMLITAFRRAAIPEGIQLVLVGPSGWGAEPIEAMVGGRVVALGRVSDATLAALYRDAVGLCFPSLAEGFGLPLLEAMHQGLPILASDLPVMREVAGEAATYYPADDGAAWTRAIENLVAAPTVPGPRREAGLRRVAELTWGSTAERTVEAYRLAAS